jgi:hypothetical protein
VSGPRARVGSALIQAPPKTEVPLAFSLVGIAPGPPTVPPNPILPVYFRDFVFAQEAGYEGNLQSVTASFD